MKKGFTLIELIGVVIVLAIISLLAFPAILNNIRSSKQELTDAKKQIIYAEVNNYISNNEDDYKKTEGNVYCLGLEELVKKGYINEKIYEEAAKINQYIKISIVNNKYIFEICDECEEFVSE